VQRERFTAVKARLENLTGFAGWTGYSQTGLLILSECGWTGAAHDYHGPLGPAGGFTNRSAARTLHRASIARRSSSDEPDQAQISLSERLQPRQMSFSSRQQLRTQGDGTAADLGASEVISFRPQSQGGQGSRVGVSAPFSPVPVGVLRACLRRC